MLGCVGGCWGGRGCCVVGGGLVCGASGCCVVWAGAVWGGGWCWGCALGGGVGARCGVLEVVLGRRGAAAVLSGGVCSGPRVSLLASRGRAAVWWRGHRFVGCGVRASSGRVPGRGPRPGGRESRPTQLARAAGDVGASARPARAAPDPTGPPSILTDQTGPIADSSATTAAALASSTTSQRQRHRPAQPPVPRLRTQPSVAPDRAPRPRPDRLDPTAALDRRADALRTKAPALPPIARRGPSRVPRPHSDTAPAGLVALGANLPPHSHSSRRYPHPPDTGRSDTRENIPTPRRTRPAKPAPDHPSQPRQHPQHPRATTRQEGLAAAAEP